MESKSKAALIIVILIIGGLGAVYLALYQPGGEPTGPLTPTDTPSTYNENAFICEVYYSLIANNEFFEFYIPSTFTGNQISGWLVTTFDGEGLLAIPTITGINGEDYIAVYTANGTNDVDASDGDATVYLGLDERLYDLDGDEIGLFDSDGEVIDFMRYEGGNGDDLYDGWSASDDGPYSTESTGTLAGSISLFGPDTGDSTNWMQSNPTPSMPNIHSYTTNSGFVLEIQSGVSSTVIDVGIDDEIEGKVDTIEINPGVGVPLAKSLAVARHIEFSLAYYLGKGFTRGPKTAANNTIKILLVNGTSTETVGKASTSGTITIKIGTVESDTDLKYVCEHELMHLFQFNTEKEGNDTVDHAPVDNKWWIEGQATYWGIESTKANFNLTNEEIQDEFDRVGDHNWNDHYLDLNRSIFIGWGKRYDDYMGSYLFMKFISEVYGEDKLKEAFEKAKDNFNNNSKDVSPEDAIAEACGKSWEQLLAEFYAWMMTDAITNNGVPERVGHINVTYTNDTVGDSIKVGPYASGVERIKVNGTQPFSINFNTPAGSKWKITIIYVYEDGSRQQASNTPFSIYNTVAPWPVNPSAHDKKLVEIIVIKTLVQTGAPQTINMTVEPIANALWNIPYLLTPGIMRDWQLPPLFDNYTDLADWPWSLFWYINYNDNTYLESIVIEPDYFQVDSFFDIYVTLEGDIVAQYVNVSDAATVIIDWDLSWSYGDYLIEIRQSNWDSWINGTIIWNHSPKPGSSWNMPDHTEVGECRAADSNEWDYDSHWYHVMVDDAMEFVFEINMDAPFIGTGNWTMELYNTTHSDVILRTTEGWYYTDEWPRYIVLPSLGDPDYSDMHEYILRLRYLGGGIGNISLLTQPYEGRTIDDPLWHTILTEEYFGIDLPYTYTGTGWVYVNSTVSSGTAYHISLNATTQFVYAEVWFGTTWQPIAYDSYDGVAYWYSISFQALTETISMRFLAEMGEPHIYHIVSVLT